ncbi:MAG: GTP-binding protein [Planctomycetota bacterium]|nr:GTP-binding protein [Planctomycetota bacterium]MEC9047861.1 GTP-binding protein [Planctomycetota bacterium]
MSRAEIVNVPTNVITGFLGAGKSTAILHLLKQKPAHERWAILVNEFGEVGIDGGILRGGHGDDSGVFIREVAGGCMCCAAGVPMQIALTSLLSQARPDRLLIEPTGLGHPKEVLSVLSAEHYQRALDLRATITLVDASKVRDPKYAAHSTFLQQLAVADVIVANKADRYGAWDMQALHDFLAQTEGLSEKPLHQVEHGALELAWLSSSAGFGVGRDHHHDHGHSHGPEDVSPESDPSPGLPITAVELPECGYVRIDNEGEGFYSQGWVFDPAWRFDGASLDAALLGVEVDRLKAVFLTTDGVYGYNLADGTMTKVELDDALDSRAEALSSDAASFDGLEAALLGCVSSRAP